MILSICDEPTILEVINKILFIVDIIKVAVPIILIISIMIVFVSAVVSSDASALKNAYKSSIPKIVAAVLIFLIPTFINIVVEISTNSSIYNSCLKRLSDESIAILYIDKAEQLVSLAEETLNINDYNAALNYIISVKDDEKRKEYEKRLEVVKTKIDEINQSKKPNGGESAYEGNLLLVETARKYIGKNVGTDCSGFVKNYVLKPNGYLEKEIAGVSAFCDGRSRGSYGMYKKYLIMGRVVWSRPSTDKTLTTSIKTFPGDCKPGDLIFYSYGANDCVKHIVVYAGYENGQHMIIDSNMYDNKVRYRAITAIHSSAMPLGCARPMKSEE